MAHYLAETINVAGAGVALNGHLSQLAALSPVSVFPQQ